MPRSTATTPPSILERQRVTFRQEHPPGAAPLSDFANMCNRGVGIARTGLDNRVDHFTWSSRERRMRISPGDRWFESASLQRRVPCEPEFSGEHRIDPDPAITMSPPSTGTCLRAATGYITKEETFGPVAPALPL